MNDICIAETYTFTNASATGENGPTQNQINTEYTGTNLANSVTINSQGIQEWVVPASGTYEIEVWGAQGGSGGWYSNSSYSSTGGLGGYAKGSVTLSAGTTVYIFVGQQGEGFTSNNVKMTDSPGLRAGGWNGGGGNSQSSAPGTGGGGASDVRVGGTGLNNRIIVAGGGGGGGNSGSNTQLSNGGNGGGLTATTLASSTQFSNRTPGSGATQNSGNALGIGATASHNLSGGGGGGYYGGGAGENSTGGGGGSSYIGGVSNGTTQNGIRSGHGKVIITMTQPSTFNGSFNWANHAGGSNRTEAFSVDVSNDGSSLISGMFFGTANFGNSISLSSTNDADGFTAKMNADGTFAWATKVGCTSSCRVVDVAVLADGSSIITGHWKGTASFGSISLTSNPTNYNDAFIAKLDANGNFVWVKQAGGTASDEAAGIAVFSDGSSVVTGGFSGTVNFGVTTLTSTNHLREIFVAKLDSNGNYLWASKAGGSGHDNVRDLTTIADGSTIITGDYASTASFGNFSLSEFGGISSFVAKLDANGSFLWATKAGENQCCSSVNASGFGVEASVDGSSIIATGYFEGECNFGNLIRTSSGSHDIFVTKLDSSGNYVWVIRAGGTSSDIGRSATLLSDGSSLITGQFQGTALFGNYTLSSSGSNDVFVGKLDANGTLLWVLKAGGSSSDYPMKIASNDNNEVIAAGIFNQTATFGNTDLTSLGSLEAFAVSIQVQSQQSPVITQGDGPLAKTIDEDTIVTWTASELNATDSDTSATSLAWSLLTSPSNGTVTVDGNGSSPSTLSYQANANYHGSDSFSVQVSDGENNDSITINLIINPIDDATSVSGDTHASIAEDSSASGDLNATDADGLTDGSYFSVTTAPANGSASIDTADGNWTYSPNPNFFGSDSFVVSITDDLANSSTQSISLTVSSVNDLTILSGDFIGTLPEDGNATGDINATDLDGLTDGSYFAIYSNPSSGSATIDPQTGSWSYTPQANFFGSDSFSVSITDDLNNSSTQSISLTVSSVNDLTILSGDFIGTLPEDGNATGDINATDLDGLTDGSYFAIYSNPSSGSATIDPQTGSWSYTPQANFFGSDSFSVSITDDLNNSSTQSISLTVSSVNDLTILSGDFIGTLPEDGNATGDINATDLDGLTDGSYFAIYSNPSSGSATIDPQTGSWSYTPQANFFGSDSFSVSITDDLNNSSTQSISLTVSSVNDLAILSGDFIGTLPEDGNATGDINATDLDGLTDGSYFAISSNPSSGSATIDPQTGSWSYTPQANFFGSDSFSVSITDDLNNSSTQSISLTVSSVNDLTILSGDFIGTLPEDGNATGDINATDLDGLTDGSYFAISSNPSNGSATIDPQTGSWSYTPQANFFGSDSFSVSITDDLNNSSTQSISLTVSSVNDLAILSGDFIGTLPEDGNATGDINATDLDGLTDGSYFAISSNPSNGSATIDPQTGSWSYTPQANFFGSDSFSVSIIDDLNNSATQSISLIVSSVNDLPYNLRLSNNQILENLPPNTLVGVLSAEDIESNQSISFSTTAGSGDKHNQLFSIDSNRTLRTTSILDFESNRTLQIRIKAIDIDGGEAEKIFEINLLNIIEDFDNDGIENYFDFDDDNDSFSDAVEIAYGSDPLNPNSVSNQAPTEISISNNTFYESQAIGLFIGKLFAVDPDDNATHTFSFIDGNKSFQNQLFEIDSNQSLRTKSLFKFINGQNDFKIRIKVLDQFNASFEQVLNIQTLKDENQSIRLGKPIVSIDANGRATIVCPVSNEGNESLPTIQFLVSETEEFSNVLFTLETIFDQDSVIGSLFNLDENKTFYARARTTHKDRSIISETTQFNTNSILAFNWWSIFEVNQAGWRNSVWLGAFLPHESGWIHHQSIGWLYAHPGQEDDFWFWSQDYKWLWTKEGIYPFLYRNNTSNWLYILGEKDGKAVFHDYSINSTE